ncbi:MAG: hypothetical protein ACOCXS_00040 [Bacteroidota bacterium]
MDNIKTDIEVITHLLKDDGTFPNNHSLPFVVLKQALDLGDNPASDVEKVFASNGWGNTWRNGLYSVHHYHSTAHEALGVYRGWVKGQFGGPEGVMLEAKAGDVLIIPAGVAHKNLEQSNDFEVVGAYPHDQYYDMNYGKIGERPRADKNIRAVQLPDTDPVFGAHGPLMEHWVK